MPTTNNSNQSEELIHLLVYTENAKEIKAAQALAERLNIEITQDQSRAENADLLLKYGKNGLELMSDGQTLHADFTQMLPRLKANNLQSELLVKASKIKNSDHPLTAIDATAGFGEDSLLLAAAGFSVRLYENNPVIAALLVDALCRAAKVPELRECVERMQLFEIDSIEALPQLSEAPDVILLDPMFPARQKSALVKKKFQLLHQLEQPCKEEEALVHAAMEAHPRKIVIKRPLKGPYLAGIKPTYSLAGKAIRYDCLVFPLNS